MDGMALAVSGRQEAVGRGERSGQRMGQRYEQLLSQGESHCGGRYSFIIFEDTVRFQLIPQLPHLQQPTPRIWVQILYKIIKTASELSDHSGSLC